MTVTHLSRKAPRGTRETKIFMSIDQLIKLDKEVLRRKMQGLDRGLDGKKFFVNRSTVVRDAIDQVFGDGELGGMELVRGDRMEVRYGGASVRLVVQEDGELTILVDTPGVEGTECVYSLIPATEEGEVT